MRPAWRVLVAAAVVVSAIGIAGAVRSYQHATQWESKAAAALAAADSLRDVAAGARSEAGQYQKAAQEAEQRANQAADERAALPERVEPTADDCGPTCREALAQDGKRIRSLELEVRSLRSALEDQRRAYAMLLRADSAQVRATDVAVDVLEERERPSLFARLLPSAEFGLLAGGVCASPSGVSGPCVGAGITLTWGNK